MRSGPFAALGTWPIFEHDGSIPLTGAAPHLTIVKATRKYIKYKRKCNRHDPKGEVLHHGKVYCCFYTRTYRVSVGSFQHISATMRS